MKTLVFIMVVTVVIGGFGMIYMHEQVHKQIYKGWGIDSHIEYFSLDRPFEAVTYADEPCPNDACVLANDLNEVVSYNLDFFYVLMGVGLLIVVIFQYFMLKELEELNERRENGFIQKEEIC